MENAVKQRKGAIDAEKKCMRAICGISTDETCRSTFQEPRFVTTTVIKYTYNDLHVYILQ